MRKFFFIILLVTFPLCTMAQPEQPVEEWTGKTILLIGAHPDDDSYAMGTLGMLNANGNEVHIVILTTGNVGTQDPKLGMMDLAKIRKIKPDVLFSFDPGKGSVRWHKADHRASAYLSADAARAAMWPLMFQGQIALEGLEAHTIPEYMLYDSADEDINTWVDISDWEERKVEALMKYVSQFSSGWSDYKGPEMSPEEETRVKAMLMEWIHQEKDGKPMEGFRYYSGLPDNIGR